MRRSMVVIGFVATVFGVNQLSYAADMPVKAPAYQAPPPIALYNWNGFYIGANIGYGWSKVDSTGTNLATGDQLSASQDRTGILGGGQIGYNYLVSPSILLGVEGDFDGANLTGSTDECRDATHCSHSDGKTDWLATLRGRAGYVMNDWLIFATGGGAWSHGSSTRTITASPILGAVGQSASVSPTHSGWTAGGGVEYGFARNWSAKLEYLYIQTSGGSDFVYATVPTANSHVDSTSHISTVRLGINYHFN
jgi:outer membrane immunogenic protein